MKKLFVMSKPSVYQLLHQRLVLKPFMAHIEQWHCFGGVCDPLLIYCIFESNTAD